MTYNHHDNTNRFIIGLKTIPKFINVRLNLHLIRLFHLKKNYFILFYFFRKN